MRIVLGFFAMLSMWLHTQSQTNSRFSLSANFGVNGSFFVRSYDEENAPGIVFYRKNFVGLVGGMEAAYQLSKFSSLTLGYSRSSNSKLVDFSATANGIILDIWSFRIRHIEHILYSGYRHSIKKTGLALEGGLFYNRTVQQEIELLGNLVNIWERKYGNARLNELGIFAGISYSRPIAPQLDLGIQSKIFYEFTSNILSQITFTPTLTYHFSKSKMNKKT